MKGGYKNSERGILPREWVLEKLGTRATFRTGPFGSALHKSDYTNDGIPIVNPMHIIDGEIVPTRTMTVTETAAKQLDEFRLRLRDVVIGRRGDMGRCAVVGEEQVGWLCGTGSMIVRCGDQTDAGFLQRTLSSPKVISVIESCSVGSTMINLNQAVLSNLLIQFPPLPEQRAIATALSDVDALIAGLDSLIAKKRDIKQAVMQQLLTGKLRLPGFSGGWQRKRLGDIATFFSGGTPSTSMPSYYSGDIPWITSGDLNQSIISNVEGRISASGLRNSSAKMIAEDTLLIALYGATAGVVAVSKVAAAIHQAVLAICPKDDSHKFLFFKLGFVKDWLITTYTQGGQPNLSGAIVKSIELTMPSVEEQNAIANLLSDMDNELNGTINQRNKVRALKQGMMQELLTSKTRLI